MSHLSMSHDHEDTVEDVVKVMTSADALFIRCELVVNGRRSLSSLNSTIEQLIHDASTTSRYFLDATFSVVVVAIGCCVVH